MRESAVGGDPSPGLRSVLESHAGRGSPLPDTVRETLEPRFDADLSDVRVHADGEAHRMATGLGARAFTYGSDIYFREGAYDPADHEGRRTLAHEVAHTVQQGEPRVQRQLEGEGTGAEADAGDEHATAEVPATARHATGAGERRAPRRSPRPRRGSPAPSLWESAVGALRGRDAAFADAIVRLDTDFGNLVPDVLGTMALPAAMSVRLEHERELEASVNRADDARTSMARGAFDHVSSLVWFRQLELTLGRMTTVLDAVDRAPNGRWFTEHPRQRLARVAALRSTTQGQFADRLAFDVEADLIREAEEARPRPDPVEQAVDYMRGFAAHPLGATATTRAFFVARHLVVELGLSNAEVRTALRRLRERSPEAYQAILMGGRLVIELLMSHEYFGLDEFVAEGEDLGSGWMRAELESLRADRPVDRRFDATDMLIAGLAFIAGAFQGVGDAIIGALVGIAELFNPATWAALMQIPALIEEHLSTPEGRYRVGQMLGEATAAEQRELREAEPFEFGRRLGQYFGRIVAEIVLAVIGIGWIANITRGFRFTGRIAEVMSGFAEVVVNSRGVRAVLTSGRFVSGVVRGILRAIRRRLIQLAAELPEWAHIFPTWRLEAAAMEGTEEAGILARALEEAPVAALTEAETAVARAGRGVGEAEQAVAAAMRGGDEAALQRAAARLDEAMGELERATARLPSRAGASTAGAGVEGARAVESASDDLATRLDDLEVRDRAPEVPARVEEPPVEGARGAAAEPDVQARGSDTVMPADEPPVREPSPAHPSEGEPAARPVESEATPRAEEAEAGARGAEGEPAPRTSEPEAATAATDDIEGDLELLDEAAPSEVTVARFEAEPRPRPTGDDAARLLARRGGGSEPLRPWPEGWTGADEAVWLGLPEAPTGYHWVADRASGHPRLDRIRLTDPHGGVRPPLHWDPAEGAFVTPPEAPRRTYADLLESSAAEFGTSHRFTALEDALRARGHTGPEAAVVRRYGDSIRAVHLTLPPEVRPQFFDGLFEGVGDLAFEESYATFRRNLRRITVARVRAAGSLSEERRLLDLMMAHQPNPSARGNLFSEYLRSRVRTTEVPGRGLAGLAPAGELTPEIVGTARRGDDVFRVASRIDEPGAPPPGLYLGEHKSGPSAFRPDQARLYGGDVAAGRGVRAPGAAAESATPFQGVIYIFDDEASARRAATALGGLDVDAHAYVGYIDTAGDLRWRPYARRTPR